MKTRGSVGVDLLIAGAVLAALAGLAGWKPLDIFKKDPPVAKLEQLQAELVLAREIAEKAKIEAERIAQEERDRKDEQTRHAQQMVVGAKSSLQKIPAAQQLAETALASDLLTRAEFALGLAIGNLPENQRAEILLIVDRALSNVQAERDQARAQLLQKDAELKIITEERLKLIQEGEDKLRDLAKKDAEKRALEEKVDATSSKVSDWARRAVENEKKAGSLSAAFERLLYTVAIVAALYFFFVFVVPGIVKTMRPGKAKSILRDASGFLTSPLLYLDAKHKLDDAKRHELHPDV